VIEPCAEAEGGEGINPVALTPTDGASRTCRLTDNAERCDRSGTLIRHAEATVPLAICSLPMAMVQSAWLRALITAVGRTSLLAPSYCSAGFAAVALAMVAMAADEKERATAGATTKAWSEGSFRRVPFRCLDFRSHLIMNRGRPDCKVTPDDTQWTMKGECDCGSEMMDVSLPIFPVEVQNTADSDDRSH
jgi:hypothetical protein